MKQLIKYKRIILCLLIFSGLFIGSTSLAVLVDWPRSPLGSELDGTSELHNLIMYIYEWGLALGGLSVFIVLVIAGMQYLTSAGKPEAMRSATDRIKSAIIGLILLLSIYLILHTISPGLVVFDELNLALEDHMKCESDQNCIDKLGEHFICDDGYCILDIKDFRDAFTPKPCEYIKVFAKITPEAAGNYDETIKPKTKRAVQGGYISAEEEISVTAKLKGEDEACTAAINFYEGFLATRCAGRSRSHVVTVTKDTEAVPQTVTPGSDIKCVEHSEMKAPW